MPYVESSDAVARSTGAPLILLNLRDFQTQITPNDTQRNTLIVAGVYFLAILILW